MKIHCCSNFIQGVDNSVLETGWGHKLLKETVGVNKYRIRKQNSKRIR